MNDRSAQMVLIGAGPVGLGMAKAFPEKKLREKLAPHDPKPPVPAKASHGS